MKEEFKPSEHQQNIYDFIENGTQNGVVSAVAGSGKTTTLVHAIDKIPLNKSILFMAFNKSIATELSNRITPQPNITIKTLHAFGMNLIVNQLPFKEQQTSKYKSLLRTILANKPLNEYNLNTTQYEWVNELRIDEEKRTQIENIIEYVNIIGDLTDLGRMNFINITDPIKGVEEICNIAKHHGITTCNQECTSAWYLIKLGSSITSIIDFTDMVYLPLIHNLEIPKYDFVFIDEVQDINACQRQMMLECIESNGGRFIAVGDEHQCQPPETMVRLSNGDEIRIDELKVGDNVISYNTQQGKGFVGYYRTESFVKRYTDKSAKILDIAKHEFNDDIIKITTNKYNYSSKYTPNHKCYIKYRNVNKYILYLMEKDSKFRIGIMPIRSKHGFGLSVRSRQEKANKSWVLRTFDNRDEAYYNEQYYSYEFGIPQLRFIDNQTGTMRQTDMDSIWVRFDTTKMFKRVNELLNLFGRLYEYPLWYQNSNIHNSRTGICEMRACNLIPEIMLVPCFNLINRGVNGYIKADFQEFDLIKEPYNGLVYSLKVSREECYVGDNILTHNSIYGFSGADADSFNKLRNIPNTIELPLSVSYRCATSIIDMVKSFVSHILPKDNAIKGSFNANKSYNDVRDGDMVLCRQTFPLVSLCLKYLSMGIKAYVNGSDIGKTLSKMIMDSKQDSNWNMQYVYSYLYAEREKMVQNAITKENLSRGEAFETTSVRNHTEKIQVIELLGKDTTNPQDVIDKINKIFSDDDKSGIMLSTIHKAKGLESENVFIIHGELMPSKHATKPWEITQEQNLRYVAYTRAKSHLAFITDFDAFKAHTSQENNVKPITQSKHIGKVGQRIILTAEIFNLKPITTRNGSSTTLIEMKDSSGNIFTKFGDINTKYIISHHKVLTKGAKVKITGEIKDHSEFRGVKSTLINIPPKFN